MIRLFIMLFLFSCEPNRRQQVDLPQKDVTVEKSVIRKISVLLYPMGSPDENLLPVVKKNIEQFYGFNVDVGKVSLLPVCAFYVPRNRYRADTLLDYLIRIKPEKYDYIMGITDKDISCTSEPYEDWGVYGYGYMPGSSSVISTFRLKRNIRSYEHFQERLVKVVLHELGHNIGLVHCPSKNCMMEDAEGTIINLDRENILFCNSCKRKMQNLIFELQKQ